MTHALGSKISFKKNLANPYGTSQDMIISYFRSHLNNSVADDSKAENCILSVFPWILIQPQSF